MPTFPTPRPIQITLELGAGDARLTATDRDDTVVEIRPRDPAREADVRAADEARVELSDGRLLVKTVRQGFAPWVRGGAVDVTVALPTGSRLDGHTGVGDVRAEGRLGDCSFKSGAGALRFGRVGTLKVITGAGDVSAEETAGSVLVVTSSGAIRLGRVGGDAIIKNGNGSAQLGEVVGQARIATGNGDVTVERTAGGLDVKTANGAIRALAVVGGAVELKTAFGTVEVGIAEGTAAKLDLKTEFGLVRQELEPASSPPSSSRTATIKARTGMGDITIRRAESPAELAATA